MLEELKKEVLEAAQELKTNKLVTLTGGNVTGRDPETGYCVLTPSGIAYELLSPDDMVVVDIDGNIIEGEMKPSVDMMGLLYILRHRSDLHCVIHTHSPYATSFAILNQGIPCALTTLANEVGSDVPCAPYTRPGSETIGIQVVEHIGNSNACLLAHHGVIAVGTNVRHGLVAAVMCEDAAKVLYLAKTMGTVERLPQEEIDYNRELFLNTYGQ
jgi:L-fuculose-phosphate aldolase/L-ribulose-5-phosphate 4-epimerase